MEVNPAEAASWYRRAAERGDTDAPIKLASIYRTGAPEIDRDLVAALRWLTIASTLSPREREADIRIDREAVAREMKPEDATRRKHTLANGSSESRVTAPKDAEAHHFYRPLKGIVLPRVVHEVRPNYTGDALRRKIGGVVWVEAVGLPDGSVGEARVIRSLDSKHGLDEEPLKAARQWRFQPGTRNGVPVALLVTIELSFRPDRHWARSAACSPPPKPEGREWPASAAACAVFQHCPDTGSGYLQMPTLVREVQPTYTEAALHAGVQGAVWVEGLVAVDGKIHKARVIRSLDRERGLDEEALATVGRWRFKPGQIDGKPVPTVVVIELTFTIGSK